MPYQVKQLIEGSGIPVSVQMDDPVSLALRQMIEHDYSQLPVVDAGNLPIGMVTYESILRAIRNFKIDLDDLFVRDAIVNARVYNLEDDLFDLLDQLKMKNAVLIIDPNGILVGIVTSYDSTEYFRRRAETLMRVEDIELTLKDFIRAAYSNDQGEVDENCLAEIVSLAAYSEKISGAAPKSFDDLSLGEYINILANKQTWKELEPRLKIPRTNLLNLLNDVREIRNALAHFKGEISAEQQDQLKFCAEWFSRHYEDYLESRKQAELLGVFTSQAQSQVSSEGGKPDIVVNLKPAIIKSESPPINIIVEQSGPKDSRYAPLGDWLQSQPGKIDSIQLTFNDIEEIIEGDLPVSARQHRAWWANDPVGHSHARQWLDTGWRTGSVNMSEGRVTFNRIREREKAYIDFFSPLVTELKTQSKFTYKTINPDGTSWIVVAGLPPKGTPKATFVYSFSRDRRMRIELYVDTGEQGTTKLIFDKIKIQQNEIEAKLGRVSWERLDDKRASRIALYRPGQITDDIGELAGLRRWAVDTMIDFYNTIAPIAEKSIHEVNPI